MATIEENNKVDTTNQIDSSTFAKAKRFRKGDAINFEYELNLVRHYRVDKTIHSSNTVEGFYEREEFNNTINRKNLE